VISVLQWQPFMYILDEESALGLVESGTKCKLEYWPLDMWGGYWWPTKFVVEVFVVIASLHCFL